MLSTWEPGRDVQCLSSNGNLSRFSFSLHFCWFSDSSFYMIINQHEVLHQNTISPVVILQKMLDQSFLALIKLFGWFWFCSALFTCVFEVISLQFYHHETRINEVLLTWFPIRLLIKSCYITKEFIVWNIPAVVVFSVSEQTKFEVDNTSIILSYLCHFGDLKKELFRYCSSPAS